MQKLGRVARLRRYPVKSMMGEELDMAIFEKTGVRGDRLYAFFDAKGKEVRQFPWPWITARQVPEMLLYEPRYISNHISKIEFFSNGERIEKEQIESLIERKYSLKATLKFDERGNHDSKPVSLISLSTDSAAGKRIHSTTTRKISRKHLRRMGKRKAVLRGRAGGKISLHWQSKDKDTEEKLTLRDSHA